MRFDFDSKRSLEARFFWRAFFVTTKIQNQIHEFQIHETEFLKFKIMNSKIMKTKFQIQNPQLNLST